MALVYKLTSPSGKVYVGKTIHTLGARWSSHKHSAKEGGVLDTALVHALRKYGPEAFVQEVVADGLTEEEALVLEAETIAALGCRVPNGYNLTSGGRAYNMHSATMAKHKATLQAGPKRVRSEEDRARMSEAAKLRWEIKRGLVPQEQP